MAPSTQSIKCVSVFPCLPQKDIFEVAQEKATKHTHGSALALAQAQLRTRQHTPPGVVRYGRKNLTLLLPLFPEV